MDSPLTLIGLPLVLGVIMLGLGLGLTPADFRRVFVYPRAALLALACQTLVLPPTTSGTASARSGSSSTRRSRSARWCSCP
jgi:BASS family bile acid:Na+ symporter